MKYFFQVQNLSLKYLSFRSTVNFRIFKTISTCSCQVLLMLSIPLHWTVSKIMSHQRTVSSSKASVVNLKRNYLILPCKFNKRLVMLQYWTSVSKRINKYKFQFKSPLNIWKNPGKINRNNLVCNFVRELNF